MSLEIDKLNSHDPLVLLKEGIITYEPDLTRNAAKMVIDNKIDTQKALDEMTHAIRIVGDAFGRGEIFLPELIAASEAMSAGLPILEQEMVSKGKAREAVGTVVIGTVLGDIHSIGKSMVSAMLTAEGFHVVDLGINVKASEFVDAVKKNKADIVALSALMTMTAPEQIKVIEELKKEGVRGEVKVMVGGGAINEEFAERIGADGYDPTAPGAAKLARQLLQLVKS
jgi:trimethylamine corrinoid protein